MANIIFGLMLGLILYSPLSWSQSEELAILPLKHRLPEQVIPALRPFLAKGGALQADNNLIIVRTNKENLAQIKTILAQLDKPLRQLLLTVKQLSTREAVRFRADIGMSQRRNTPAPGLTSPRPGRENPSFLTNEPEWRIGYLAGTRTRDQGSNTQQVRVMEGQTARVQAGHSIPMTNRAWLLPGGGLLTQNSVYYHDVVSGFEVLPRIHGDEVTLDIRPYQANPSRQGGGRIAIQKLATQVSVPLGRWLELGGADGNRQQQGLGTFYGTHSRSEELRHFFIRADKVE
ncbi:secretin N-terminal domain-containing protein [Nitrosococcus watsonii]|uniref:NolW domain protein n=1 Tax=Nitrosococcus watsoni (strain C-113) TaxID=105559 RepID=D8K4U8_NITWC|nr:secretin N-terminal domain-containing protein [Nitrosococcus watsonii]ADJ27925.1 NolW domain protein [Nitrosococcus watsonii C-113]